MFSLTVSAVVTGSRARTHTITSTHPVVADPTVSQIAIAPQAEGSISRGLPPRSTVSLHLASS